MASVQDGVQLQPTAWNASNGAGGDEPLLANTPPGAGEHGAGMAAAVDAHAGTQASSSTNSTSVDAEATLRKRNVRMGLLSELLITTTFAIAAGAVFDKLLYFFANGAARGPTFAPHNAPNTFVGIVTSFSGILEFVVAVPFSMVVDRAPRARARILKFAFPIAVLTSALAIASLVTYIMLLLYAALFGIGLLTAFVYIAGEAIFQDSIPVGCRTQILGQKTIMSTMGSVVGPLLTAALIAWLGDDWAPNVMVAVCAAGFALLPIGAAPLLLIRDPNPDADGSTTEASSQPGDSVPAQPPGLAAAGDRRFGPLQPRHVPILVAISDLVWCMGAGMTLAFFNLFFIQELKFTPLQICALQIAAPCAIGLFVKAMQPVMHYVGRAQTSLAMMATSTCIMFLMSGSLPMEAFVALYLLRGGLANASRPIDKAILVDFTPSSQRGRWSAVEAFSSLTWTGSAFLGGVFSDEHDYRYAFRITAFLSLASCIAYLPMLALVPWREADLGDGGVASAVSAAQGHEPADSATVTDLPA
eukprot:NODE_3587_length_2014_cov_8.932697.p1 GENE.NODE_3587_length_2014_cov_8.932697~~NODE_3587_length_2014_cov_8.932697.p1  ORF type:complete len:530 (+),score=141.89 NODE_3587_length_2014_cov_8.932697:168-1757(+)